MSYPYGHIKFGLSINREQEFELGSIAERNLRELFLGSPGCIIPDQIVDAPREYNKEGLYLPLSGFHSSDFGLDEVGYTEYMDCRYIFYVPNFELPSLCFEPGEIESLDPSQVLLEINEALQKGSANWDKLILRVNPTELFWKYVSVDGVRKPPQILKLTLSN